MKKTGLRFLKYALAGVLLLPSLTSLVFAEGEGDTAAGDTDGTAAAGTIRIKDINLTATDNTLTFVLPTGVEQEEAEFADFCGTENPLLIDVYKVADIKKGDKEGETYSFDAYSYKPVNGITVNSKDIQTYAGLQKLTRDDWNTITAEIAGQVSKISPYYENPIKFSSSTKKAVASGLTAGLYLVLPHDKDNAELKDGHSIANTSLYEYHFMPQLVSLPTPKQKDITDESWEVKDLDDDDPYGQYTPTKEDEKFDDNIGIKSWMAAGNGWSKEMEVMLKPARTLRFGQLQITKTLESIKASSDGTLEPATFVFEITGTNRKDGKTVEYHNYTSVTMSKTGEMKAEILRQLPLSSNYVVEEVYTGAGYECTTANPVTLTLNDFKTLAKDPVTNKNVKQADVGFTNKVSNDDIKGYGVKNKFAKDDDAPAFDYAGNDLPQPANNGGGNN